MFYEQRLLSVCIYLFVLLEENLENDDDMR